MKLLLSQFLLAVLVMGARAATWNAVATRADINSKLAGAAAGDTINIAAGTVANGAVMSITKGITIVGAGTNSTIIQGLAFSIALSGSDARVELSHFKVTGPATETQGAITFGDDGDVHEDQFVAHDLFIIGHWSAFKVGYEGAHGVVYNCALTGNEHHGYFGGYLNGYGSHVAPPWAWDSQHSFVYENCTIGPTSPEQIQFVTEYPFRYTLRHCNITERSAFPQVADMHGGDGVGEDVGVIIHDNNVDFDNDGQITEIRGGGYCLVYDNTDIGSGDCDISLDANCSSSCDDTHHTYIFSNSGFGISTLGNTLNVNYFTSQPGDFAELTHPHPLRAAGGGGTVYRNKGKSVAKGFGPVF